MTEKQISLAPEPPDPGDIERSLVDQAFSDIGATLDAESHRVVVSVLYRDTADDRESVARRFTAEAQTDLKRLKHAQESVGTLEQIQAIKRTGACPDARFWLIASWCLALIDAAFWYIATAQVFAF